MAETPTMVAILKAAVMPRPTRIKEGVRVVAAKRIREVFMMFFF
tara:strand:+ start:130 stop:261 length:132 start_codon:yes stop_codon:yes gene_type:complete